MIENKFHNYILKIHANNKKYFINTFNNAIIELDKNEIVEEYEEIFKAQGFFEKNEVILKEFTKSYNSSKNDINITISLTEACNFDCIYCSQHSRRKNAFISKDILNQIIHIISEKYVAGRKINIFFFGGEPLLQKREIVYFVENITKIIDKEYLNFFIETNGFLLDKKFVEQIPNVNITVTLSLKKDHDKKRYLANGSGTFETILNNIKEVKDLCQLTLRYNVDDQNILMVEEFLNFVKDNKLTEYVQFSYTYNFGCKNYENNLPFKEFQKWYTITLPKLLKKFSFYVEDIERYTGICKAYMKNSFKVYSNGLISACNGHYENDCNFNIFDKDFYKKLNKLKQDNYPILNDCKNCKYLLYCGGHKFCNKNTCIFLEHDIKLYYKNKLKEGFYENNPKIKKEKF